MGNGNWEAHLRHELALQRRAAAEAAEAARWAELALSRRLMPGEAHAELTPVRLPGDARLVAAREEFRERYRRLVTLRDECEGIEADLAMIGAAGH